MIELLKKLRQAGISAWLEGESLKVAYESEQPEQGMIDELKQNREALISFFMARHIGSPESFHSLPELNQFPLSFSQERMLFVERYERNSDVSHVPLIFKLDSHIQLEALDQALAHMVERHSVLRTVYRTDEEGNDYQQVVADSVSVRELSVASESELLTTIEKEIRRPFDLVNELPLRVCRFQYGQERYQLFLWHHIAVDGWSLEIFLRELAHVYDSLCHSRAVELPELAIDYADYSVWLRDFERQAAFSEQMGYWTDALAGHEVLSLPTDRPRPKQLDFRGKDYGFVMDEELSTRLRDLARAQETTLYSVLLSGLFFTFSVLSGQRDIVIGTPSENRNQSQTQSIMGFFVNSLPLRLGVDHEMNVESLIRETQRIVVEAKANQDVPFERLVSELGVERDTSRHPLIQTMFSVQSFVSETEGGLPFKPFDISSTLYEPAKFELTLRIDDSQECLQANMNYAVSLFDDQTIVRMTDMYQRVLAAMVTDTRQVLSEIDVVGTEERHTLLKTWNQTDAPLQDKTLLEIFEQQVEATPDSVALTFEGQQLTYSELNFLANQLARQIRTRHQQHYRRELKPDTLISLYFERGLEMLVSMFAVLKAGGAYVPISPQYPLERTLFILEDTGSAILLSQRSLSGKLEQYCQSSSAMPPILLADDNSLFGGCPGHNLDLPRHPADLAYVIYTSGTTGKPKGVMIEGRSLVALLSNEELVHGKTKAAVWANYVFDASVYEIFSSLLFGSQLHIVPEECRHDPDRLFTWQNDHEIEFCYLPPFFVKSFASYLAQGGTTTMTRIFTGVDRIYRNDVLALEARGVELLNAYGPSEATVCSTAVIFDSVDHHGELLPIGKVLNNEKCYVLSEVGALVPVGVTGELCISGTGLARGYLNRPELTAECFINNPFADGDEIYSRLYKTGDLVRWLPDGLLEYVGRNDNQVKIRGFRVELGEIESTLTALEEVSQAVVSTVEHDGSKTLVAYVVAEEGVSPNAQTLETILLSKLPDYMVPASITFIDALPLTINGKLDRLALPAPQFVDAGAYVAPRTAFEARLCEIWQDVLGRERVGIQDNFFQIGGDSISAIRLTAVSRQVLDVDIPLPTLFERKTIAALAAELEHSEAIVIPRASGLQAPLSFAQERLLFVERFEQGTSTYHTPLLVKLASDINWLALETAIEQLTRRHSILRTVLRTNDKGEDYQQVLEQPPAVAERYLDSKLELPAAVEKDSERLFNLGEEPAFRVHRYLVEEQQFVLFLWHHIAFDGWSFDIFLRELGELYQSEVEKRDSQLAQLDIQYSDYACWQREYLQGLVLEQLLAYWREQLTGYQPLQLVTDKPRPPQVDYRGRDAAFTLDKALSGQLRKIAKQQETTLYTVLLSGLYVTLSLVSGQDDIVVGTPSENRHHGQTQSLIGFFVNSLALRYKVAFDQNVENLIADVHQMVMQAKFHQELPFELLVNELDIERDPSRNPIFQVMFSVQRFGDEGRANKDLPFSPAQLTDGVELPSPAKFDLSLFLDDSQPNIIGNLNYALSLFDEETARRLIEVYREVLTAFSGSLVQSVASIDAVSSKHQAQLAVLGSKTSIFPREQSLIQLFEARANECPDIRALTFNGQSISFRELNIAVNQLAGQFIEAGVEPGSRIGIHLERSPIMVAALLAVLKVGGCYVPMEPGYSAERLSYIATNSGVALVVTAQPHLDWLAGHSIRQLTVKEWVSKSKWTDSCFVSLRERASYHSAESYIVYTSGSTGQPKGVKGTEQGVLNRLYWMWEQYPFAKDEVCCAKTSLNFVDHVWEIFGPLLQGVPLLLVGDETVKEPSRLAATLAAGAVTRIVLVPSLLKALLALPADELMPLERLKLWTSSGEPLSNQVTAAFYDRLPQATLLNLYGSSEVAADVSWFDTKPYYNTGRLASGKGLVPIGRPIANTRLYVLNSRQQLVPLGGVGELYVAGDGVSAGYTDDQLTAERFISDLVGNLYQGSKEAGILFRTGDLVRWNGEGELEYLGRNDFQVKIRGHRIEPGEIEHALNGNEGIREVAVIARERDDNPYLAAYLVPASNEKLDIEAIRQSLASVLPAYMQPTTYTLLDKLPLNSNGKLDRSALPEPERVVDGNYIAPRNDVESMLCQIWQDLLGVERVGINNHFFHLGGHSLLIAKLVANIKFRFDVEISYRELFERPVLSEQAELIEQYFYYKLVNQSSSGTDAQYEVFEEVEL
ncbi:non-ribosomal peptide synthetase [Photobacterium gaetbulicola]|uniref:Putative amino acid adenylation domain protein n=1 Tax=Photobacterium gaetbulicola Gung47 TaxID=658445 RepID=A0A0C5W544_9GAMM|nr:non-ribosomal peptide synthetase [Photobacterium gaetbulicola]AJR06621.1 putative amino acid adenylation domain protein [Photobacterium gaetbulicola Gung47]PSU13945.1 non-ribosomal peptide synthetase [Photobacterium gaetbulicola]